MGPGHGEREHGGHREDEEGQRQLPHDEAREPGHGGPAHGEAVSRQRGEKPPVGGGECEDGAEQRDLDEEQAAVTRADQRGDAADLDPGVPETRRHDQEHRRQGEGGETPHGEDGVGPRIRARLSRGGAQQQSEGEERAEPETRRHEVTRVRERGDQAERLRRRGVAGPRHRGRRRRAERPGLDPPRRPVDGGFLPFTEQEERHDQDEEAVPEKPDGAEAAVQEQAEPDGRLEQRIRSSRDHHHLVRERREPREQDGGG